MAQPQLYLDQAVRLMTEAQTNRTREMVQRTFANTGFQRVLRDIGKVQNDHTQRMLQKAIDAQTDHTRRLVQKAIDAHMDRTRRMFQDLSDAQTDRSRQLFRDIGAARNERVRRTLQQMAENFTAQQRLRDLATSKLQMLPAPVSAIAEKSPSADALYVFAVAVRELRDAIESGNNLARINMALTVLALLVPFVVLILERRC
jgi:hypothetical protein